MTPRIKKIFVLAFSLLTGLFLLTNIASVNASRSGLGNSLNPVKVGDSGAQDAAICSNLAIVTTTADSGAGSLRDAMTGVCAGGTIIFDQALTSGGPATITLLTALPDISSNMTITGPGSNLLTVERSTAQGTPEFRIFTTNNRNVAISGMKITNGKTPDGVSGTTGGSAQNGGGILQAGGILTLTDVVITGNRTGRGGMATGGSTSFGGDGGFGGGISSSGTLTMTNCVVSDNVTGNGGTGGYGHTGGYGGGIYLGSGSATLTNVIVSGNRTGDGGIGINSGYSGGNSGYGGGIYSAMATLNMTNVNVSNNATGNTTRGDAGLGGGIMIYSGAATLTNSTVSDNLTGSVTVSPGRGGLGGGLANFGTLTVTGSTVSGNATGSSEPSQGTSGGGIFNGFILTAVNSTISGNRIGNGGATFSVGGGGIASSTLTVITNCTVTGNTAPTASAGGIYGTNQTTVSNTIIAGNTAVDSADVKGALKSQGHNLIGVSDGTNGFTNGVSGDQVGTAASPVNALLGPLSNNGGLTRTHLLTPGSPAVNAGDNTLAKDQNDNALATDQRGTGYPRIINTTVDIGAVEVSEGNYAIYATVGTPQSATINTTFATQLQATVTESGAPKSGVSVSFTAPATGAGGTFANGNRSVSVVTDSNGVATAPVFTADGSAGSYNVVASFAPGAPSATFNLTNLKGLAQVNLLNLEQTYIGTQKSVAVTTNPAGLNVAVTYDGSTTPPTNSGSYAVAATINDANYNGQATGTLTINKATATVTLSNLSQTYNGTTRNATATTSPSGLGVNTVYSQNGSSVTFPINVGAYNVTATISNQNYQGSVTDVLVITRGTPTIFWNNPANIIAGTPLGSAQLNASASVPGTFQYDPPAGTLLNIGAAQLSVTFTPNDAANYTTVTKSVQLTVDPVPAPALTLNSSSFSLNEGAGHIALDVIRTGDTSPAVTVNFETTDNAGLTSCNTFNGVASSRCDYAKTIGTLRFAAGETIKTIYVPLVDDSYAEGPENLTIRLSNPGGGASLGSVSATNVTIADNDMVAGVNPIVDVPFFIRQQYIDFLGREPDPQGFAAWQDILNKCVVGDTSCDRIAVSSGFFRSEEFQSRGYFIYRFYTVSLGRTPRYSEFMPDMAKVSGFLDPQQLEANKVAFINEFMSRSEFSGRYATATDPALFVNGLLQTAGLENHPSRDNWVNGLTNGTLTRADVLRGVVESTEAYNKFYNEGFVVMQYFGYLRRDPDILYLEWIKIMNQNGENYRGMITGFLNSSEYATRFGQ